MTSAAKHARDLEVAVLGSCMPLFSCASLRVKLYTCLFILLSLLLLLLLSLLIVLIRFFDMASTKCDCVLIRLAFSALLSSGHHHSPCKTIVGAIAAIAVVAVAIAAVAVAVFDKTCFSCCCFCCCCCCCLCCTDVCCCYCCCLVSF